MIFLFATQFCVYLHAAFYKEMALVTRRDILRGCETFVSSCTVHVPHLMVMVCWLLQVSEQYCNASLCWVQEEHKNMGAWSYVQPRTQTAIGGYHRYYICLRSRPGSPNVVC